MTSAPTRIRVHGGRVAHAVTAYPGGRLRTECFYDLGVGDVSCRGHCALPADAAVTCRACLKELARKEVPPGPGGDAQAESEPRPMRPEDVPGKVLAEALEAWTGYDGDPLNDCDPEDVETAATILAAAYPAIGEHLAAAIEANPSGECSGAVAECARLVRNLTQGDQ